MSDYAGVGSRIVAVIIDSIILGVVFVVLGVIMGVSIWSAATDFTAIIGSMIGLYAVMALVGLAYFTYFEGSAGQTLGKKLVGITVVKDGGRPATYADALVRTLLRIIDGQIAYLIGFILVLATENKQRIGDMLANTLVVKA